MGMDRDFLHAALAEEGRLLERLAAVRSVIASYRGVDGARRPPDTSDGDARASAGSRTRRRGARSDSKSAEVIKAAEDFLSMLGHRAESRTIAEEVRSRGIIIPGLKPISVVASYLSNSPKFDNRGGWVCLNSVSLPIDGFPADC